MNKLNYSNIPVVNLGIYCKPQSTTTSKTEANDNIRTTDLINKINSIDDDLTKVVEYNNLVRPNTRYVVVDKANCVATVYEGKKQIDSFNVCVGKTIGDDLNTVKYDYSTQTFSESGRTTPSGEFITDKMPEISENGDDFTTDNEMNIILLNGVTHPADFKQNSAIAFHQFPNSSYNERLKMVETQVGRKSVSSGCVNLKTSDFNKLASELGTRTSVYILPEEEGNSLELIQLPNGKLWFKTKYKDDTRENALDLAMKKYFKL